MSYWNNGASGDGRGTWYDNYGGYTSYKYNGHGSNGYPAQPPAHTRASWTFGDEEHRDWDRRHEKQRFAMTEYERNRGLWGRSPLFDYYHQADDQRHDRHDNDNDHHHPHPHHANDDLGGRGSRFNVRDGEKWERGHHDFLGAAELNNKDKPEDLLHSHFQFRNGTDGRRHWDSSREWQPQAADNLSSRRANILTNNYDSPSFHQDHHQQHSNQQQQAPASPRRIPPWERTTQEAQVPASPRKIPPWERDREDFQQEPQVRMPASPRKIPPWERDRNDVPETQVQIPPSPRVLPWERDRLDDQGQSQGHFFLGGLDPRRARVDVMRPNAHHHGEEKGGAFLFVRFPLSRGENLNVAAKACILAKTSDLGGRFVGIAKRVFDFGYPPGPDEGCAVFQFPNMKQAEKFFHTDKRIRQPDFPPPQGHAEIFAVCLRKDPNFLQTYDTFLLSEIHLNEGKGEASLESYREDFMEPFSHLLQEAQFHAMPYAAFCTTLDERRSLRRHFFAPRTVLTLHLFRDVDCLEHLMADRRYSQLRSLHNGLASEQCSIFTINRQACP